MAGVLGRGDAASVEGGEADSFARHVESVGASIQDGGFRSSCGELPGPSECGTRQCTRAEKQGDSDIKPSLHGQ